jgi:hypothetical protein
MCRATDRAGGRQNARVRSPHPSGATGYPTIAVNVS